MGQERSRGFTLIEILVVIGLLSMLFVVLLPMITEGEARGKEAQCRSIVASVGQAIEAYERQRHLGDFPPDDFKDPKGVLVLPADNGFNGGIESCLIFLNRTESREGPFPARDEWLGNTDGDKAGIEIPKLQRTDKPEVLDPWGNPLAYFHFRNYGVEQHYRMAEVDATGDSSQPVTAWKIEGRYANPRSFQVFSAGPNGVYGDDDDIGNFEVK